MEIPLPQNTEEWLRRRRGAPLYMRVGGSEIGAVCGLNPYSGSRADEMYTRMREERTLHWLRGKIPPQPESLQNNPAIEHGSHCEDLVIEKYSQLMKKEEDIRVEDGHYYYALQDPAFLGCSPDGQVFTRLPGNEWTLTRLLECKAPYNRLYPSIPVYYMTQVQYQMGVTGVGECDFVAVKMAHMADRLSGTETYYVLRVPFCDEYWQWMRRRLEWFQQQLLRNVPEFIPYPQEWPQAPPHVPNQRVICEWRGIPAANKRKKKKYLF